MKTIQLNIKSLIVFGILFFSSCTYDFPEADPDTLPTAGDADFSKIVSVGNSLTAGYMNGALYTDGQNNSYASILAHQATIVGGGDFNQPDVNSENGCFNATGGCTLGRLYLKISGSSAVPTPTAGDGGAALAVYAGDKTLLNNFGVPGVTLLTAQIPQTGDITIAPAAPFNPYYYRIASVPGTSTLIGDAADAMENGGTFFTFWLGNNDVLGYATGGAETPALLTNNTDFGTRFNSALDAMLDANENAMGAVANIPDVTSIPYFKTVPYNPVVLIQAQVDGLNPGYAPYNGGLDAAFGGGLITALERDARKIVFVVGQNPVTIVDEKLTDLSGLGLPNYRFATSADLVVLPAASFIGTLVGGDPTKVNGVSVPLADKWIVGGLDGTWVATSPEKEEIQTAVSDFNDIIEAAVAANSARLVLVDANTALSSLPQTVNGISLTSSILPPYGAFSLDGVHPNARGSAYIANIFITAINTKFEARIPLCNPNDYAGNALPIP